MAKQSRRQKTETYLLVTVISLMVWLYAEGENVSRYDDFAIGIRLVPAGNDVVIDKSQPQLVKVTFSASKGVYESIRRMNQDGAFKVVLTDDPNKTVQTVAVRDALNNLPSLNELGVTIERVEPATIDARVERLVKREVPISVAPGEVQLAVAPSIAPPKATVTMPSSLVDRIENVNLEVRLEDAEGYPNWTVGEPYERSVRLSLPDVLRGNPNVKVEPEAVTVGFTVRKLTKELTLARLRIMLEAPLSGLNQHVVKLATNEDIVRDLKLSGPNDVIDAIEKGEIKVTVVLKLSSEELKPGKQSKLLYINKPESVRINSVLPSVDYEVLLREDAAGS